MARFAGGPGPSALPAPLLSDAQGAAPAAHLPSPPCVRVLSPGRNRFHILRLVDGTTAVGFLERTPPEGLHVALSGDWVQDQNYGRQFKFSSMLPMKVSGNHDAVVSWLQLFKGVGPEKAELIWRRFGPQTYDILRDDPDRLMEIRGVGKVLVDQLREDFKAQTSLIAVYSNLEEMGLVGTVLSATMVQRIIDHFQERSVDIVKHHPYQLSRLKGVGFLTADRIARELHSFDPVAVERVRGAISFCLRETFTKGHTCFPFDGLADGCEDSLLKTTADTLFKGDDSVHIDTYDDTTHAEILAMDRAAQVHIEGDYVYTPRMWQAESDTVKRLTEWTQRECDLPLSDVMKKVGQASEQIRRRIGVPLDETQQRAAAAGIRSPLSIITGPPGSGKTTLVKAVCQVALKLKWNVGLCAPTGKASRRLEEATGLPAATCHRLLGAQAPRPGTHQEFAYHADHPLDKDLLICDEDTMKDLHLSDAFFAAVKRGARVLLVGDIDQLPSVGPGAVFSDLVRSQRFPVTRLTKVYRNREGSNIAELAVAIRDGILPDPEDCDDELSFIRHQEPSTLGLELATSAVDMIRSGFPPDEVQILVPTKKGRAGVPMINYYMQQALGRTGARAKIGVRDVPADMAREVPPEVWVYAGDRVRQTKNHYKIQTIKKQVDGSTRDVPIDALNGDIGTVLEVDPTAKLIYVQYPGLDEPIRYEAKHLRELDLAYALTTHTAQGSEWQCCLVGLHERYCRNLLQRNLFYTAVSRARSRLILMGTKRGMAIAVRNDEVARRHTRLAARLRAT